MCSRFEIDATPGDIAERFGLAAPPPLPNAPEIRPTDMALIIDAPVIGNGEKPRLLSWGLAVEWDAKPLINARAETLSRKKTFRALLENRCLVPATAYFEWRKDGPARRKNRIGTKSRGVFAFAGLTDGDRFIIITCPPAADIASIHDRMPVILERRAEPLWIDRGTPFNEISGLLVPYGAEPLWAEEETPPPARQPDLFS
ncbi:MAG: SOS response-associated peptidase [Proteobacteria bacterium]|nr:SOS response-associated peptidase [Pseudomonadota bacterium]